MRHQMDRFMAAFVVYARKYLKASTKDSSSEQIIYRYAKQNQCPPTFHVSAYINSKIDTQSLSDLFLFYFFL